MISIGTNCDTKQEIKYDVFLSVNHETFFFVKENKVLIKFGTYIGVLLNNLPISQIVAMQFLFLKSDCLFVDVSK